MSECDEGFIDDEQNVTNWSRHVSMLRHCEITYGDAIGAREINASEYKTVDRRMGNNSISYKHSHVNTPTRKNNTPIPWAVQTSVYVTYA